MRNFHVALPEEVYVDLMAEAERMKRPATSIAREAIESWLRHRRTVSRHRAISEFARKFAGTKYDLDSQLEAAGAEHLAQDFH
jgi:hypothetical protein